MKKTKKIVDILMSIILLFLMAFQVTGDKYHEWIGAGMLLLFIIHNALNFKWYQTIFKGRHSMLRLLRTVINFAVLISIILTGYSGVVMSRHVFAFLPIDGGIATARVMHLAASYWAFVLMSIHLGMHWIMVTGKMKILSNVPGKLPSMCKLVQCTNFKWILRFATLALSVYGAILFGRAEIFTNMFLQNEFAILDYETPGVIIILQNLAMMVMWIFAGHYVTKGIGLLSIAGKKKSDKEGTKKDSRNSRVQGIISIGIALTVIVCSILFTPFSKVNESRQETSADNQNAAASQNSTESEMAIGAPEGFVLISGGSFQMGSPETESWRSPDETQHLVNLNDFYMSEYELTQTEYQRVMGNNPASFVGENLPIENVSWLDAITYCNTRSEQEGLTPAYLIDGENVSWNRGADGYRLPTEAEWEYACRAGTTTPFNTETSISAEESNYYGHYPYEIEGNYFEQDNLTTQPGQYRETTVAVDSFSSNAWGLYNMHGNVSEWVWDYYGEYGIDEATNPTGSVTGNLKVYRGGGWNDFAKNMRSAYRATLEPEMGSFNIGIRLVRNAVRVSEGVIGAAENSTEDRTNTTGEGKVLIAYFSWGGNTQGVAEEIQAQMGADLFEITLVEPYSDDYNTVLDQAQHDQNIQARPEIADHINNMDEYDTVLIGYPNWWASIPMPIASFLEEYDFSGKTIIPFCSHGGGRFGQSLTAIAKLAPDAKMGEGLSIHYSGGSSLASDVERWLRENEITKQ